MAWILTITVTHDDIDPVSERLWELDTSGVAVDDSRMMAGFDSEAAGRAARAELGGTLARADPTDWDTPAVTTIDIADRAITVDAGRSFGHGNHPTTRLCLGALHDHLRPGQRVLDVGCGSGVLALAAKALGAAHVTAIDLDEVAIAATRANATTNRIELDASTTDIADLADLAGPFEVVVANMLVSELEPIADDIGRLAAHLIIVSGALVEQRDRVLAALSPWARLVEEAVEAEWFGATFRIEDR